MLIDLVKFFHSYRPQPIISQLGPISIHWYGLLIVVAILIGFYLTSWLIKKYNLPISQDEFLTLTIYLILVAILGARLYHILSEINYYWLRPLEIFYLWQGGLGIFGAMIASVIFLYFYAKKKKWSWWLMLDLLTPAVVLGEAIGRWGNWFNQENFGRPTNLSWGIPIDIWHRPTEYLSQFFFHPTFFYQFTWNLILFIVLLILFKRLNPGRGFIFAIYLIGYSLGRFLIEFLRINPQPMFLGLRLAQVVCLILFVIGILILACRRQKNY